MKTKYMIFGTLLCGLWLCLLPSCRNMHEEWDEKLCAPPVEEYPDGWFRLKLSINMDLPFKRALPSGGEEGEGREPGTENENAVESVTVFLYEDRDVNSDEALTARILKVMYFNKADLKKDVTGGYEVGPIEVNSFSEDNCRVLAVLNADFTPYVKEGETLAKLRDLMSVSFGSMGLCNPEKYDNGTFPTNFLMSSVRDIRLVNIHNSTIDHPATASGDIQRLAARVDYRTLADDAPSQSYYEVKGTDAEGLETVVARAEVLGATVVNRMSGNYYLFKHVADDFGGMTGFEYVGLERPIGVTGQASRNWVLDPYYKNTGSKPFDIPIAGFSAVPGWENGFSTGFPVTNKDGSRWHCIGYVRENTNLIQSPADLWDKATGVVFKVRYTPFDFKENDFFEEGVTFYAYKDGLYRTLEEVSLLPEFKGVTLTDGNCTGYGVERFPDGICYYTYYIKHSEDDDDNAYGTMEYAITRNSLYQLNVKEIDGLGDSRPDDSRPGETKLYIEVTVKNWTLLPEEEVDLQ